MLIRNTKRKQRDLLRSQRMGARTKKTRPVRQQPLVELRVSLIYSSFYWGPTTLAFYCGPGR